MRLKLYLTFWKRKMEFISGNKKGTVIPLIWLLIYLSIVPMQMSNYVLCIGADGHVEFEIAVNGRCTDTHDLHEAHTEIVRTADTAEENHCGSCLDLPILASVVTEPYLIPVQDALIHPPAPATIPIAHPANGSMLLTYTPLLDFPSIIDPTLASLRTTTLLI